MIVSQILSTKGDEVITASVDSDLMTIVNLLSKRKIGAVVIVDGEKVCGICSERDVVRELAADGSDAFSKVVSKFMTRDVISCTQDDTIDHLMEKMTEGRFRHIPVMDGDKLIGLISIGDVVKRKISEAVQEAEDLKRYIAG